MRALAALMMFTASIASTAVGAVELYPDRAAVAQATARGAQLAAAHEGYLLKDYVTYAVRDSRAIDPADGLVDAVVVTTLLERTRHAAFIASYSGKKVSGEDARKRAGLKDGEVGFLLFVHGRDPIDQEFATGFGPAALIIGEQRFTSEPVAGEPSQAVYPLAPDDRIRFVTTITYRFDLSSARDAGHLPARLQFTDASGKHFDLPVELGRFH